MNWRVDAFSRCAYVVVAIEAAPCNASWNSRDCAMSSGHPRSIAILKQPCANSSSYVTLGYVMLMSPMKSRRMLRMALRYLELSFPFYSNDTYKQNTEEHRF